ncbi:bifunctional GDP-fucose synthetase: GDP-4-dehydro-6-deoxy-D-mannose epimerase and GDP-4-dehydro-6-L-deoxygalactose reductase [Desulfamplus magnetovallimortis]|uniref:GDP-L-fucose synthase n=1 Tax=Desulfamplus magnetovallimortis TaxID=1246637 RepID=A0A1W1H8G3_9BACT|nr:GDP-L-fucose synthase [Desulfamplus magnetovallimortis]SLM28668.1 bifunctional GDP-fucose synthetase: GDP-4-dehydro-6-deoxy-D-mannose epimerase and GDP-4-dehydro-6-L-deoxygalactose reductase [Desulfamplus magnetovallimortis]
MNKNSKIFIAGAGGMVGSAIIRNMLKNGFQNLVGSYHSRVPSGELFTLSPGFTDVPSGVRLVHVDLTRQHEVELFFENEKPEYVFLAAAKVGGIYANNTLPAQFIRDNLAIQTNVIHAAYENKVERLLFLGSSCIYPKDAPQPMEEESLLTGLLEPTNEPYALAKIAGIKMCEAYNREYGTKFIAIMPTNLYGPHDNFDLESSHVIPALIRKFHEAKQSGASEVVVWGTGSPRREFLHVDEMADASIFVMSMEDSILHEHLLSYPKPCFVNVGTGKDCTIKALAEMVQDVVGYEGRIVFDRTKPDGTLLKLLDVSSLAKIGWQARISLKEGLHETYKWFLKR